MSTPSLKRPGKKASVETLTPSGRSHEVIVETAGRRVDLIVMGAYGKNRAQEDSHGKLDGKGHRPRELRRLGRQGAANFLKRPGYMRFSMERIDVITYAGRKGDERPEAFILRGLRIDVVEIVERWIEEGFKDRVRKRCFKVKGSDGNVHTIYFDETGLKWYYSS